MNAKVKRRERLRIAKEIALCLGATLLVWLIWVVGWAVMG